MTAAMGNMLAPPLRLRRAVRQDAAEIANLFLISSDGLASYIWSRLAGPGQTPAEVGTARYGRTGTEFSFENCILAGRGNEIAGMAHAFPMSTRAEDDVEDDPVLAPYAQLEAPGSLYLSGLAVHRDHRGKGIGSHLMDYVEELAIARYCPGVSLICFERNEGAMRFYRRRGYREMARRPLVPHPALRYSDGDAVLLVRRG